MRAQHPTQGTWKSITLMDGTTIEGELTFDSFGTIGAHAGFYHGMTWYPLHAVRDATR